ncbi:unhealthy ribosome biogenesis protein 2 homolog [Pantherophis guttatus]|uniref:Unhealthy ribosome biogenesis protein 2 homolog n=1 Tax=Pantherophis guttatus TaxID=94885 RepID=A0A6P9CMY3_PANGU|nr:unhealthy ribosome biogenesis protein 2 homolog [Pantherophis guttatus]XP_034284255.1 unhealthy ribosome biogenesis protein 2 homolog [Pantherophis guttatus]
MAAIYSGIHLKLKSSKTSWEDKLKLARFAWISHQCFLPNKEQVLLDWVSHSLISCYNKKLELPDEIIEKLWIYLDSIIHSKKLQNLFKDGKTVTLRYTIAQVINENLSLAYNQKTLKNVKAVLSCCSGILSKPPLSIVYTAKFELLVDLLSKLSWLTCWQLSLEDAVSLQLFEVLQLSLKQYLLIQRQQSNVNRVFGQVTQKLLQPCLLLRYLLTMKVWTDADDDRIHPHLSKEVRNHVESLLKAGIFQQELLSSYREELLPEKESVGTKKLGLKNLLLPANTIQASLREATVCEQAIHGKVVAHSVPLLFKLFLETYNKPEDHLVCFHMLSKLYDCLRISCLRGNLWDNQLPASEWSSELLAVEQLLNLVLSNNIYNVAADRIRHKAVQFNFYRQLAQLLMNHSQATIPAWFRCLKALISLNHLIVDPDLDDLVALAWIDAEVSEPRTKKAQTTLVSTVFSTYAKLRQFPNLFQEVLSVILRPAAEESRLPLLPASIRAKLCECLLDLPSNQVLDIVALTVEKCQTFVIPHVKGDADVASKLLSISTLLYSVLFHMKSLDDSTPLSVVHRTQNLLETVQKNVIQVLFDLLKSSEAEETEFELWTEKVSNSALLLACVCVESDTLFALNCKQYSSPLAPLLDDSSEENWDFSTIFPGLDAECWEKINKLVKCSSPMSSYCTEWLVLQKMKKMLMHTTCWTEALHQALQSAGAFILQSGRASMNKEESEPWDGSASSITALTYPVAHWHLVLSNLPVLFPYLSENDTEYIAEVLLRTLLVKQTQSTFADEDDFLFTMEKLSKDLLHSSLLPELQMLHCFFLSQIIQHCASVLSSTFPNIVNQPLQLLCAGDTPWCEAMPSGHVASVRSSNDFSISWAITKKVALNILQFMKERSYVTLEEEHIKELLNILEVISALNVDSFFPLDFARCFLLLISLAVNTRASISCNKALSLKFLATCCHLLACLQAGRHANSSFKVLYASDVLEALLNSMFAVCKTFGSVLNIDAWDEFLHELQLFLEHYLQVMLERRQSMKMNLEKFLSFITSCQPRDTSSGQPEHWSPAVDQVLLVALISLCHVLATYLQQHPNGKLQISGMLTVFLKQAMLQTGATIKFCLRNKTESQPLPLAFIPHITTLLKADSFCFQSMLPAAGENELQDPMKPSKKSQLFHRELYQSFCVQILRELELADGNLQFLHSALQFLTAFCSMPELYPPHVTSIAVFNSVRKLLAAPEVKGQLIQDLDVPLTELIAQLVENGTIDDFSTMLRLLIEGLNVCNLWKQNPEIVLSAVTLLKVLLNCPPLSGEKEKVFWFSTPQIMTALAMQIKEASQDPVLLPLLSVPILEAAALLLRRGEGILSNPHHVALVFNILLTVPLDQRVYNSVFLGIHEVLFSILQCHPKVMLKAAPSFLNSFHRLVISVMHEGRQKGDKGSVDELEAILKCAQLVERMYSYIAAKTEDFTVMSAFIVAQYVIELQKVTLHPAVKKHLTEGIYHIIDLCKERDIKFLNVSLPAGVREVFKELYRDYAHYHKALKQGDEKYKA